MGNLYRLNSLFELEISQSPKLMEIDKSLLERSSALEYLFLALSNKGDYTILSEPISEELLEYWDANDISYGQFIQVDTPYFAETLALKKKLPKDIQLVEWGDTSILNLESSLLSKRKLSVLRSFGRNSKITQYKWKESFKCNKLVSIICFSLLEIEYTIRTINLPIVVKSEIGFSGRGLSILKTEQDVQDFLNKLPNFLKSNPNGVLIEEWVESKKIQDFSGLFELSPKKCDLIAVTKMLIDKNGSYRGSIIQNNFGDELIENMTSIVKSYIYHSQSYKGPLSIDGFSFYKDDEIEIQYMSEINFRFSMGRVLFDLHKKIGSEKEEYALFFFPLKNKNLTFKMLTSGLNKISKEFKSDLLLLTPLTNASGKKNSFLVFYVRNKKQLPLTIMDSIKKLLS